MKNREGNSRRFGFIGFKSGQEAENAVKYFNDSFIDTARIHVEIAQSFGDTNVPMDRKRGRIYGNEGKETAEIEKATKKPKTALKSKSDQEDAKLNEFLGVMSSRTKKSTWANDDLKPSSGDSEAVNVQPVVAESESDDEYQNLKPDQEEEEEEEEMIPLSSLPAVDSSASDFEWLKMRQKRIREGDKKDLIEGDDEIAKSKQEEHETVKSKREEPQTLPEAQEEQAPLDSPSRLILESGRLFLRNLLYSSTEEDFTQLFSGFGDLQEVHLPIDNKTNKPKGFAYIQFKNPEDALRAYESLDKQIFQGRLLHILAAQPKHNKVLDEFDLKNLPLKKQNDLRRKAAAAKQQFSWNSLYLNNDAVLESVAHKLGIKKSQLIDPESSDSAVKQALAEASLIGDVRTYFESKGVDLLAFNKKENGDTAILVKNLPFDTTLGEITDLFGEYGDLQRILMPPGGGIAIVIFKNAPQGRAAFTKLAYRRFKTSILYLEKGPKGLLQDIDGDNNDDDENLDEKKLDVVKDAKISASDILPSTTAEAEDDQDISSRTSLFVKNLNFQTNSEALSNAFKALDGFTVAQVKMKPNPKIEGGVLSMGFGFVEFNNKANAEIAQRAMDGYVLDGHKLQCKISTRGQDEDHGNQRSSKSSKSKMSPKILIKNIPFETTKKDIQQLFGAFGQLRTVRVPRKFDQSARGFAFAVFVTAKEADNAMRALQGTHLLGRRLVMEFAQVDSANAEEEISRMEAKVRKQTNQRNLAALRLSGKRNIDLEGDGDEAIDM